MTPKRKRRLSGSNISTVQPERNQETKGCLMQHVFPLCCIISVKKKAQIISRTSLLTDLNGLNVGRIRLPTMEVDSENWGHGWQLHGRGVLQLNEGHDRASWNDTLTIRKINDWWKQQGSFHCQTWGLNPAAGQHICFQLTKNKKRWSEMYTDIHTCTHSPSWYISDVRPITEQHWTFPWPDITFIHLCLIRFQGGVSVLWWFVVCVFFRLDLSTPPAVTRLISAGTFSETGEHQSWSTWSRQANYFQRTWTQPECWCWTVLLHFCTTSGLSWLSFCAAAAELLYCLYTKLNGFYFLLHLACYLRTA